MADLNFTFNPEEVNDEFEPIPAGVYKIECVKDEWADAKSGVKMLVATFKIIDGEYSGKQVIHRFMPDHHNETAAKIARVALKRWCEAVGHVGILKNTTALHFKPFEAEIAVTKSENNGREYIGNEIKRWGGVKRESAPGNTSSPDGLPWK